MRRHEKDALECAISCPAAKDEANRESKSSLISQGFIYSGPTLPNRMPIHKHGKEHTEGVCLAGRGHS